MDKRKPKRSFRQLPAWMVALIDVLAIGVCLLVFAYFDHVRPSEGKVDLTNQRVTAQTGNSVPQQTSAQEAQPAASAAAQPVATPDPNDWRVKFADQFVSGEPVITENSYKSANVSVTLIRHEGEKLPNGYELAYHVLDVYVADIECLRNVFAKDTFGKALTEPVLDMAQRVNAVGAINGDYYGHGNVGIVIRNGVLYRDSWAPDQDVMVLFRDGTMKAYARESEFDAEAVMAAGAWQAWSFGPSLLKENGDLLDSYPSDNHDPRTVFGMVEPGHYLLITIDGRQSGYSEGTNYEETAQICKQLGCVAAYNLDGGKTSQMIFQGKVANRPYKDGREVSDIMCIVDMD